MAKADLERYGESPRRGGVSGKICQTRCPLSLRNRQSDRLQDLCLHGHTAMPATSGARGSQPVSSYLLRP